jgi:hypothetical protein
MLVQQARIHHDADDELRPALERAHERPPTRRRRGLVFGCPRRERGADAGRRGQRQRREAACRQGTTTTPGGSKIVLLLAST